MEQGLPTETLNKAQTANKIIQKKYRIFKYRKLIKKNGA